MNIDLNTLISRGTRLMGRGLLLTRKYSPELLTGVGIVGVVSASILACKATLKVEEIVEKANHDIIAVKELREISEEARYSQQEYAKDLAGIYSQAGIKLAKLYGPSVTLGVSSIACLVGAQGIMRKRNIAIAAAYKTLEQGFNEYRKRVIDEHGEGKDLDYRHGVHTHAVTEEHEGKTTRKIVATRDPNSISAYARFFDEYSLQWQNEPEYNLVFLKCQQTYANDLLRSRGHLFLNEVYDMLGIPRTQAGAVVGWVINKNGDNFVDFGMYDTDRQKAREFVNGYEKSILLDFNVDGVIWDLI